MILSVEGAIEAVKGLLKYTYDNKVTVIFL